MQQLSQLWDDRFNRLDVHLASMKQKPENTDNTGPTKMKKEADND